MSLHLPPSSVRLTYTPTGTAMHPSWLYSKMNTESSAAHLAAKVPIRRLRSARRAPHRTAAHTRARGDETDHGALFLSADALGVQPQRRPKLGREYMKYRVWGVLCSGLCSVLCSVLVLWGVKCTLAVIGTGVPAK
eukprot:3191673-Pyramimonas_sp.AAC.1